jgi:hypothetical protein
LLDFFNIATEIVNVFVRSFLMNFLFLFIYLIIIYFIRLQYAKYTGLQENIAGIRVKPIKELVKESIFFGGVTGFLCSFIVVFAGITINIDIYQYLFFIIIALGIINIRFICFSYAGGILALASIIFKIPNVDITSILALIAILHFAESILIYISAGKDSMPVLIKHKDGIVGAFFTQKYWPVPVVLLTLSAGSNKQAVVSLFGTDWWRFLTPDSIAKTALSIGLACIVGVLGFSDVAITKSPEERNKETSFTLLIYSLVLLLIAVLSSHNYILKVIGVIFSIVVHEGIVVFGKYREKNGKPLFMAVKRGLKVFDVHPDGHAQKIGIKRGDVILSINGKDVQTEEGVSHALKDYPTFLWISAIDINGNAKTYEYKCYPSGLNNLGIMIVPRENQITYNVDHFENISVLKNLVDRFRGTGKSV